MVHKQTVLVVDDDQGILTVMQRILELEDYRVLIAADGDEALETFSNESPDLVLLDIVMPVDGFSVCQQIRKFSRVPIIMVTAKSGDEDRVKGLDIGADDYITKPFSANELVARVKAVLRRDMLRDEKAIRAGNPFTPMTGVDPAVFGGRNRELEFFQERLNRTILNRLPEHFLVLGDWGIGKSTLLKEYKRLCQSHGYIATLVPLEALQANATLKDAAHSIIGAIVRDLPYPVNRLKRLRNFFSSVGISVLGTGISISRDTSQRELSTQSFLHDTLKELWADLRSQTEVLIILLDDLDNFVNVPEILTTLKQTLSMEAMARTKILVGVSSTPITWRKLTSIEKHHPLSRYFMSRVELAPLSEPELRETVVRSLAGTNVSVSPEVLKRIYEYTAGHPFEMQLLCYHLFNNQLQGWVGPDVWEKALGTALNDIGIAVFEQWFTQASREEAKVLRLIAQVEEPMLAKTLREIPQTQNSIINPRHIAKYLQRLEKKGLVSKSGRGLYLIPDRMFRLYIRTRPSFP